jgi:hypothetical protein
MVGLGNLADVLLDGMASAIRLLVTADPEAMRPTLQLLADDPHENAQYLLYQGLREGGETYAGWAAEILLQGPHRFLCGFGDNSVWEARQVIQVLSPLIGDELFARLEEAVRDLRFPWEMRRLPVAAFTLLSALEAGRLSEVGRRRLGELRRAVGREQPAEPEGMVGGSIGSPSQPENAARMSDENWLGAMRRYPGERQDFRTLTGGASELSNVLKIEVAADPIRFARLARRLTADINSAYGNAILMGFGEADSVEEPSLIFDAVRHIASLGIPDNYRWLGYSLRRYLKIVPADLVELIRDLALNVTDPTDDSPRFDWQGGERRRNDLWASGINTARGSLAQALGELLVYDIDGSRTALVAPVLKRLANDPVASVRTGVAQTIAAALRYARPEAIEAFGHLIETDDLLLATEPVVRLILYLGNGDPAVVRPTIERMLASHEAEVREAGGELAAFGAMQWDIGDLLHDVLEGDDIAARRGAARTSAHRLPHTANAAVASDALLTLVEDDDDGVREAAAEVAGALRGRALRPFEGVLKALIASPAFRPALPQLLITLEHAPDRVDGLVLLCAQRFVAVLGREAADIRTGAAGDARSVGRLIIRGLAQSRTAPERTALLDVLDQLLLAGAYGVDELIGESERPR